jgi:hypothetical protein
MNEIKSNKTFIKPVTEAGRDVTLTVGDASRPDTFSSFVQFDAWGEDIVSFDNEGVQGNASFDGSAVVLTGTDYDEKWTNDNSVVRWKRIFKHKPASNVYRFRLGGNWQDFDWFQQPTRKELAQQFTLRTFIRAKASPYTRPGEEWDELTYADGSGCKIPMSAHGSIAVYHKTKANNKYKTGKLCHILMPRLTRADGQYTWGEKIEVVNGHLEITLPQAFLDQAELDGQYPVEENATFGDNTTGSNVTHFNKNTYRCFGGPYSPASDGTLDDIQAYFDDWGGTATDEEYTAGLYPDSSGSPDSQAPVSGSEAATTILASGGDGWRTFTPSGCSVSSGSSYWFCLGHGSANNNWQINIDWTGGSQGYDVDTYSSGNCPNPFSWTYFDAKKFSIYGNYTYLGDGEHRRKPCPATISGRSGHFRCPYSCRKPCSSAHKHGGADGLSNHRRVSVREPQHSSRRCRRRFGRRVCIDRYAAVCIGFRCGDYRRGPDRHCGRCRGPEQIGR